MKCVLEEYVVKVYELEDIYEGDSALSDPMLSNLKFIRKTSQHGDSYVKTDFGKRQNPGSIPSQQLKIFST